ncbi:MAG: tpl protein [Actinobacteria bacterium HGW-Actinobacteria-6]|jgi:cell fate regulator YaaT (PSP1 superfamily)|nr:MAG: tpl protein [Actinobacteria bacterium HGW-Actinobacteria-6]
MPTIVGVKFKYAGKVLYFDPAGSEPVEGGHVVVVTERGEEYGEVVLAAKEVEQADLPPGLKPILRVASEADETRAATLAAREPQSMETFRRLISKYKLDMKPIGIETLFDDSKMVFYFVAEERVDFRDLVRDLASEFKTRIDMRQIGVRDEARLVGGLGHCGEQLCCVRFGGEFQPVSIRMAKEQDLPLNPLKISGLCGRLMCCLRYEFEAYKDFKSRAPRKNSIIQLPDGLGKVIDMNTPKEMITLLLEGGARIEVPLASMDCACGKGCPCRVKADAFPEVEDPAFEPVVMRDSKPARSSRSERPARSAQPASAEPAAPATEEPKSDRKRRRRGGQKRSADAGAQTTTPEGGQKQGAQKQGGQKQNPPRQKAPKDQQTPKPAGEQGSAEGAPSTSRRRRRRRPSGQSGKAE